MAFIGNTNTTQAFTPAVDYFSGNGSTTAFTLSRPVASVAQVEAVIDNVVQNPSSAYTISSNTITFTSAPLSGTNNIYVRYTSPITQVIAPGQGTVNTTALGNITNIASGNSSLTLQTGSGNTTAVTIDTSQRAAFVAGTAALPAITTSGDTNTGIFFPAADTIAFAEGGTEAMRIDSSGNVGIGTTSPSTRLSLQLSSATTYTTSTRTNQGLTIYNSSLTTNGFTGIEFSGEPTSGNGGIAGIGSVVTGSGSANLVFGTRDSATYAERMRIDSSGNLLVGCTALPSASVTGWGFDKGGGYPRSAVGTTANSYQYLFYNPNGQVGAINTSGSATAYNTSSDYRLKENIAPMTGALAKVAQLKPVTYKWKIDGSDGEGFIAHELAEVKPDCVTGEKDAVDADGNPKYQGIDTSFLVATLTAALQETKALIDTQAETINALTARIEALENK